MRKITTIIFDFDGTLYQDRTYVTIYLQDLFKDSVHAPYIDLITKEAEAIISGDHIIKLGQFVDMKDYVFCGYEPLLYKAGIKIDAYEKFDKQYRYIGDGWQVCFLIATVLGLSDEQVQKSFLKIRTCMTEPAYHLHYNKELPSLLTACKTAGMKVVLATNTIKAGAQYFLKMMQLDDCFDEIIYDAGKPLRSKFFIEHLIDEPSSLLAIGDVPYNDLYPILKAGGYTVLLSEFQLQDAPFYHKQITTFNELNQLLLNLIKHEGVIYEETDCMEC